MTQGLFSITKNGKTILKVIVGCDGYMVYAFSKKINLNNLSDLEEIYQTAIDFCFGCEDCLVVQSAQKIIYKGKEELSDLYKLKFDYPDFNPRWESGLVDQKVILEYESLP